MTHGDHGFCMNALLVQDFSVCTYLSPRDTVELTLVKVPWFT